MPRDRTQNEYQPSEEEDITNSGSESADETEDDNQPAINTRKPARAPPKDGPLDDELDDEHQGEDIRITNFVDEVITRAEALAELHSDLTFNELMAAFRIKAAVSMARKRHRKQNLFQFISRHEKEKGILPQEWRAQEFDDESQTMIPGRRWTRHIKENIMTDPVLVEQYRQLMAEDNKSRAAEPATDRLLKLQKKGLKSLVSLGQELQDHGVHTIIMAVAGKETRPTVFTSKNYGQRYYALMAQKSDARDPEDDGARGIMEFKNMIYGTMTYKQSTQAIDHHRAAKTNASGSIDKTALRNGLRVRLITAISKSIAITDLQYILKNKTNLSVTLTMKPGRLNSP